MRLYLAHPILNREDVRKRELAFEERTGIELFNPFYDGNEADMIKLLDSGKVTLQEYSAKLNEDGYGREFVEDDLRAIDKNDGVVAVIYRGTPTIGTSQEVMHAVEKYTLFPVYLKAWLRGHNIPFSEADIEKVRKPVYIVTNFVEHIWLRWAAKKSGGFIVETWSALEERLLKIKEEKEKKNGN